MFTGIVREFLAGLLALLMCAAPAAQVAPQPAEESSYVQEIEKVAPARTLSASAGTLSLDVDSPVGSLPKAAKASLSKVSKAKLNKIRKEAASLLGTEIIDAVAFDISFLNNGVEIEPDGKVNITVNFPAIAEAPCYTIIHFRDDGTTEIVPGNVTTTSATFSADNFSVYAVVGTGVIVPRVIVTFMNGDQEIATMYVKKDDNTAEELATILYDPGVGTLADGETFKGWTTDEEYTKSSEIVTIAGVRTAVGETAAGITEATTQDIPVTYYAAIFKHYTITYISGGTTPVTVGTASAEYPNYLSEPVQVDYKVNMGYTVDDAHNFEGWIPADSTSGSNIVGYPENAQTETVTVDGETSTIYYYENSTSIKVTGDVTFVVKAPEGKWLIFDENGKGGKYNAPQFVLKGVVTHKPCENSEMTRYGYSFDGWYLPDEYVQAVDEEGQPVFDENDDPVMVPKKDTKGYVIVGTNPYNFGDELTENTTIYAKWIPNTSAPYTVIFWTQNLARNGYEVAGSAVITNGTVGLFIPYTSVDNDDEDYATGTGFGSNGHYTGFCLTEASKNQQIKIEPEGDSVLNLRYDRIKYNFKFYLYRDGNQNNQYDYANNSGNGSSLNELVTWHSGQSQHPTIASDYKIDGETVAIQSESVSGRTYYYFVMPAYYGEDISGKWPTYDKIIGCSYNGPGTQNDYDRQAVSYVMMVGTKLKPNPTNQGSGTVKGIITVMNENILGATNKANGNYVVIRFPDNYYNWRYHIWFETIAGVDYSNKTTQDYNGKTYYEETVLVVRSSNTGVENQNDPKYTGFDFVIKRGQNWNNGNYWTTTENNTTLYNLNFVYNRQQYKISYFDGLYVDGDNNTIQSRSSNLLHASDEIGQGVTIADEFKNYEPTLPEGETGYVFEGWFLDEGCTTEYTWSTMPVGGITVYAKWRQIQYRVFLHPNAEADQSLSWGNVNQGLAFRISYGKKVSAPTGTRNGYKFLGWYSDPDFSTVYNATAVVLNETTVTTPYDQEATNTDPVRKTSAGYAYIGPWDDNTIANAINTDLTGWDDDNDETTPGVSRYWVTKRLDLYAKWSKILEGADGINVKYEAKGFDAAGNPVNGTDAPVDNGLYPDNANVTVGVAPTAPTGYVFDHWVIETWNGSAFTYTSTSKTVLPGETFLISANDAKVVSSNSENGTKTYTVQIIAIYKKVEAPTLTHIYWYDNYTDDPSTEEVEGLYHADNDLKINQAVVIYGVTVTGEGSSATTTIVIPERTGYKFHGWTKTKGGTTADFLVWDGTNYKTPGDDGVVVTHVAADEKQPYDDLYAVWEAPFYIYHSGVAGGGADGKPEAKFVSDLAKNEKIDLTKVTSGTYYGGYYLKSGITTIPQDGAAYDGTNWVWGTPETASGKTLTPVSGETYYIKEVPNKYLQHYTHISFLGSTVKALLLVTDIDDSKYAEVGFTYKKSTEGSETVTNVSEDAKSTFDSTLEIRASLGSSITVVEANTVNSEVTTGTGLVGYLMLKGLEVNTSIQVQLWWKTADGVTVTSTAVRTIETRDGTTNPDTGYRCYNQ